MEFRYGSLFSGIEAASLAFEPLGWTPEWFAEIDPFCCQVLNKHWPHVPNLGDVTNSAFNAKSVDLIIGGSPCPSFSLAGKRKGIEDTRGELTLQYCKIINKMKPKWFIWENVPGVLSANNGNDFEVILHEMVKSGYGVCWRVLDARCFGLPQSRKRLYVVGRLGAECPIEVLFESDNNSNASGQHEERKQANSGSDRSMDVVPLCLRGRECGIVMEFMKYFGCLRASTPGASVNYVWDKKAVRRLTPIEYERLQGMPDNHTKIAEYISDYPRWKAIGNSMAVPVVRWIGRRIETQTHKPSSVL